MGEDEVLIQGSLLCCIYCNVAKQCKNQGMRLLFTEWETVSKHLNLKYLISSSTQHNKAKTLWSSEPELKKKIKIKIDSSRKKEIICSDKNW